MNKRLIFTLLVMAVIITCETYADINEGLIGWWMLDEGTGTSVADSSGAEHDGFFVDSTPEWVPGMYGKALEFDGSDRVEIPDHQDFHFTDSMSVALWMKPQAEQTNSAKLFIKQKTGQYPYSLQYDDSAQGLFATINTSTRFDTGPHIPNFPGQWAHLCFTFDGSILILYKDGEEVAGVNTTGRIQQNNLSLSIGSRLDYDQNYNGIIDDVRLFNRALTPEEIGLFMVPPVAAVTDPSPADGAEDVLQDVALSWVPVDAAARHDIYFGTDAQAVSDADTTDTTGIYRGRKTAASYSPPETLEFGKTYFWRVDEIGTTDDTVIAGNLWSFTVELFVYPVANVAAVASSSETDKEAENTVNGSGLDDAGLLHTNESVGNMWLSKRGGEQPTWIEFQFDRPQKLYEMWIWNSNDSLEPAIGLGFRDVTIEYSADDIDYTTLGTTHEFTRAPGEADYAHNTTIDMGNVAAKYVKLTANTNWENILEQFGLSEVRFFSVPVGARGPSPTSGTTDVVLNPVLGWKPGREAANHIVFFSDDLQAVMDAAAQVADGPQTTHPLSALDVGTTYYWRIDEVNDAGTPSRWPGEIWNFTTVEYLVVDDFESYNDLNEGEPASNRIYLAWLDGFDSPAVNGSIVGYADPPFAERAIVHGGSQSMPFSYNNDVGKSEATLTLSSNRNWTASGVGTLTIWYIGNAENAAETMYVVLNGTAGVDNDNPGAAQVTDWTEWNIGLMRFADQGVNLADINTITLGFGDRANPAAGGSGIMYFDDIRLYRAP
ncbi:MAG: hypothetical protein JW837_10990 [Sedimentisphaerales bacterium]|nr:hypothetical protein [Sedimentisphaerales bacterium]